MMNFFKMIEFVLYVRCKSCVMFVNLFYLVCLCFRVLNLVNYNYLDVDWVNYDY